jgi:2-dehydro-3-deoxy-D-gluconate 5-dehydrogenase
MIAGGRGGSVINIGSMYSLFGAPAGAHYTTAKTGLIGLTRALAVELAPHDIRVNAILPGWIATEMTRMVRESALAAGVLPKIPLARFGVPDDLVGVAILLASPAGRYITGAEIAIDGGYHVMISAQRQVRTRPGLPGVADIEDQHQPLSGPQASVLFTAERDNAKEAV